MSRRNQLYSSTQMRSRFERCKTPMGSVPISVIMGFDYPLEDYQSGRGEKRFLESSYNYSSQTALKNQSGPCWPSSLYQSDDTVGGYKSRLTRSITESREMMNSMRDRYVRSSDTSEHPRQQPCSYPAALSTAYSSSIYTGRQTSTNNNNTSRYTRAQTVTPMVVSPWKQNSRSYLRSCTNPSSRTYFSSVRSKFL